MQYKKTILKNGIRLIVVPMPGNPTITAGIGVNFGSSHEDNETNGIAHFLEHMCFKGTKTRDRKRIVKEFESVGASNNAYTNSDHTYYYFKVSSRGFKKAFRALSDMYANSNIPSDELEKERTVILEEINRAEDSHTRKVFDALDEIMFEGHPLSKTTLGPKKNIKKFKREDFLKIIDNKYVGSATTVIIAGDIKNSEAKKIVEQNLGHLEKGKLETPIKYKSKQKKAQIKVVNRKIDQSHVVLGFKTFNGNHKDAVALGLLTRIVGRGFGSRFFEKIREELGLCYTINVYNSFMYDTGAHDIYAGVGNSMINKAVTEIINILKDVKANGVTEEELKRAKDLSINYLMMNLETSGHLANFFGGQELGLEDMQKPSDVIKKIRQVTLADIKRVARKIYKEENMNLAILGPHKDAAKFKKLLKI